MLKWVGGFPSSPVAKALHSQLGGGLCSIPCWGTDWIPHIATRDPECGNEDRRSQVLQLRSGTAKINKYKQTNKKPPTNQATKQKNLIHW